MVRVDMDAGSLLRRVREASGLTQEEMARRAATSRPTLSAYEHGRKSPSADTLERLVAAAGFELDVAPSVTWREYGVGRGRTGWVASRLWRLEPAKALATVVPPLHLEWSVPGRPIELSDRRQRARLYEVVLREGTPQDFLGYVDGLLLADAWKDLVVPATVRAAWRPVIEAASDAGQEAVAS
jgi:transcriptional regulator with XRE-family HTH domain